jgi:microcompartment protein CcmK/EutM
VDTETSWWFPSFLAEEDLERTVIVDHEVVRKCFHRLSLVILAGVDAERCLRDGTESPVDAVVVCVVDPR